MPGFRDELHRARFGRDVPHPIPHAGGMLREFVHTLLVDCPRYARSLGLAHEHAAIAARHRRVRASWAPHLAASRAVILAGADRCAQRRLALVIGAGDCLDVPVVELAARFDEVVLADIVLSLRARWLARRTRGHVRCVCWDATGALARLAGARRAVRSAEARRIFEEANPGAPPGGEPDLVVSANCLSQLGLVPGHSLSAAGNDDGLPDRCAAAAARVHLAWLAARPGVRVLLADTARLDLAADGRVLKRDDLRNRFGLRAPDRSWRWQLAPVGEWSPDSQRVHEVGAWFDGPAAGGL
jgi:hypothetical protein